MTSKKEAIVVDDSGYKTDYVLTELTEAGGIITLFYDLKDGDALIFDDIEIALSMVEPKWDGEKWVETGEIIFTDEMLESLRTQKMQEINLTCEALIKSGVDVETSQGIKHFSLSLEDQLNLMSYKAEVDKAVAGMPSAIDVAQGIWYHADGEPHGFWSVEDFNKLATKAFIFKTEQLTYCEALRAYVKSLTNADEIKAVTYGVTLMGGVTNA